MSDAKGTKIEDDAVAGNTHLASTVLAPNRASEGNSDLFPVEAVDNVDKLCDGIERHKLYVEQKANGRKLDFSLVALPPDIAKLIDWRDLDLREVNFGNSDVNGIEFVDCELSGADFSRCKGVESTQFAGSILRKMKLPNEDKFVFPQLATIGEMSKNCGKYFVGILSACAFLGLTIVSTPDVAFMSNSTTANLPIVGTAVSIKDFFRWAPVALLAAYSFFLINLQYLWRTMASLPSILPDGRDLDDATYPWLVNSLATYYSKRLRRSTGTPASIILISLLLFCVVPATLLFTVMATSSQHTVSLTFPLATFNGVQFAVAIYASRAAYRAMGMTLSRSTKIFTLRETLLPPGQRWFRSDAVIGVFTVVLFVTLTMCIQYRWPGDLMDGFANLGFGRPFDVTNANVSKRSDDWKGSSQEDYLAVNGPDMRDQDLPGLRGTGAFFVHADLRGSNLSNSDLVDADFRAAKFERIGNILQGTPPASLSGSNMDSAKLDYADLDEVNMSNVCLNNASLTNAELWAANLEDASLEGADLTGAELTYAGLNGADLAGANLTQSNLHLADLTGASLIGAVLVGTDLTSANLTDASFNDNQLVRAIGDDSTILGPKHKRPKNWPHQYKPSANERTPPKHCQSTAYRLRM